MGLFSKKAASKGLELVKEIWIDKIKECKDINDMINFLCDQSEVMIHSAEMGQRIYKQRQKKNKNEVVLDE